MAKSTIARHASAEMEISRSRFVATAHRIDSLDELAELVRTARRAHPDARHVCSAGVAGGNGEASRSNDDGEPGGTAGAPILSAIAGRDLTDVAVLVVRWFGGVKLGTGGLVRAYGGIAAQALDAAGRLERVPASELRGRLAMADAPRIEHALRTAGHQPVVDYSQAGSGTGDNGDAALRFTVDDAHLRAARALLAQLGVAHEARGGLMIERPPGASSAAGRIP
ncbi:YigZ family protein [Agrococcus sp. ARC_14]|uniref:IMPACT family protein n=1 Tax=Agrococcus sp. ARC_14 TaxID=2919927 RepID=UPI001F06A9BA|nr:YigZ family protein [Agrococcus sp. ARC_14]MCH1883415.1 YigZ family protein [Agrococcus sp. ARC_14]